MTYKLTLTDSDFDTIAFVGERYCWSANNSSEGTSI